MSDFNLMPTAECFKRLYGYSSSFRRKISALDRITNTPRMPIPNLKLYMSPETPKKYGIIPPPKVIARAKTIPVAMLLISLLKDFAIATRPTGKKPVTMNACRKRTIQI